jgi:uncharacterized protein YceH (UPF0502 family)
MLLRGAKTPEEKLKKPNHIVHFDSVWQNPPNQRNQFYIESSPVCNIVALKRAILKF